MASHSRGVVRAETLIVRFGQALHRFGEPADRVEAVMTELARQLSLCGAFFALPTSLHAAFGEPGRQSNILVRLPPTGEFDLGRLIALDRLAFDLARGRCSIDHARRELELILEARPRHRRLAVALAYGLVSAASARVLGGGFAEVGLAAALGLAVGVGATAFGARPRVAPVLPALAGFGVAALAATAAAIGLTPAPWSVTLAALIVLLPGLTLTLGMREVATGHLAAGSARLTGVASTFLVLGCGIALGDHVGKTFAGHGALVIGAPTFTPLPAATEPLALLLAAVAFAVLFQAPARALPWIVLGGAVAWIGARLGALWLDVRFAPVVGALALGVTGNAFARLADRPAVVVLVPGLLLLVPGSLGATSLSALLSNDVVGGMQTAFTVAFVTAALVSGLLLANALVAPRRAL